MAPRKHAARVGDAPQHASPWRGMAQQGTAWHAAVCHATERHAHGTVRHLQGRPALAWLGIVHCPLCIVRRPSMLGVLLR